MAVQSMLVFEVFVYPPLSEFWIGTRLCL